MFVKVSSHLFLRLLVSKIADMTVLPGMNLLIILFRFLTSSDPGTQSSSLSSLSSVELSLSLPVDRFLRFLAGVLRVRHGSPAGTAGTGSPGKYQIVHESNLIV